MAESVLAHAPQRFALVGHSLGGIVALEIVRLAPQRVSRLVLLNCSGRGRVGRAAADLVRAGRPHPGGPFRGGGRRAGSDQPGAGRGPRRARRRLACVAPTRSVQKAFCASWPPRAPGRTVCRQLGAIIGADSGDQRRGRSDLAPAALQAELAEGFPVLSDVTLPGAGHMLPMDSATELARVLGSFLAD